LTGLTLMLSAGLSSLFGSVSYPRLHRKDEYH